MLKAFIDAIKTKYVPRLLATGAKIIIRLLLKTCRFEVQGLEHLTKTAAQSACILMLWHNRLILVAEILNRFSPQFIYTAFISNSRDGEILAQVALSYKAGRVLRVSHNGRRKALKEMICHLKKQKQVMLITPDGPRGPCYVLKPGVVLAAQKTSAQVIPFSWKTNRYWQLNTWDRIQIPKPFSKIEITFGSPLSPSKDSAYSLENDVALFESALQSL